ncbi:Na+/H+ antiporter NhaA [Tropheryma whipplei]|uniref:Na(+)/H(+) antiporter NhaA n=1 Tax=Tropheryma whipplei (strain Twist) TaxID=203267 RepID=NHAA_TROWT|nr:Na+/H+ antiporter NhaA [Tropheryma whipplei]Q83MP1.1 RecName: Full=Na(+)/H(+) antiporter NhaA; AltName: Full=Sodium/proton antiporter NhaA [Tropheryma whipplei str. Twist]AAO44883.1 sodium-proton antiporter [Tropheryma whipplei str. Twist]
MSIIRSERYSAIFLLCSAALAIIFANVLDPDTWHAVHSAVSEYHIFGLITPHDIVADFLLAVFFFAVAIELKHELVKGELSSFSKAIIPGVCAAGGILVPISIYLSVASVLPNGWPVPTATDVAFSLGILAIFGSSLPSKVRIFLLALAVLDDLAGIVIIATAFSVSISYWWIIVACITVGLFGFCSYRLARCKTSKTFLIIPAMLLCALAAWVSVYQSGIHATIAGVMLGIMLNRKQGAAIEHALEPYINGIILPAFAFLAAMVRVPHLPLDEISPALWGILLGLLFGKLLGISVFGIIALKFFRKKSISFFNLLVVSALGGIGFTVSLLMNELAFLGTPVHEQGVIAVLIGSLLSAILAIILMRCYKGRKSKSLPGTKGRVSH